MKKWQHYPHSPWEFHEDVVASKQDRNLDKTVAQTFNDMIYQAFLEYEDNFYSDSLGLIQPRNFTPVEELKKSDGSLLSETEIKRSLHDLYDYDSFPFAILKYFLTTTEDNQIITTCPICTCEKIGSLDHIIPRQAMVEFSTNPLNLIPSCTKCNGKKSTNWKENNVYKYINPYLDDLSDKEYLRVMIIWIDDKPVCDFETYQGNGISDSLYAQIHNHFHDLELCTRFREAASEALGSIANSIQSESGTIYSRRASLLREGRKQLIQEGQSYWLGLLKIKCASDRRLFEYLLTYKPSNRYP